MSRLGSGQEVLKYHGTGRVWTGRVGPGRAGSVRVGSGRAGSGGVGSSGFQILRVGTGYPDST